MTLITLSNRIHPARAGLAAHQATKIEPCPACGATGPWTVDDEGDVSCVLCGRLHILYRVVGQKLYRYE